MLYLLLVALSVYEQARYFALEQLVYPDATDGILRLGTTETRIVLATR